MREGVVGDSITVSGNTAIDALYLIRKNLQQNDPVETGYRPRIMVTCHRRENFGTPLAQICAAVKEIALTFPHVHITWVSHPNPAVSAAPRDMLSALPNVEIHPPMEYPQFLAEMIRSHLLISDSGGIQEEGPALGIPVLVTREQTERPEAAEIGATWLVGTDPDHIVSAATALLSDTGKYQKMANAGSPYGDGRASEKICDFLQSKLHV
jgi:UDP-N-acetylglucosamine 2-epimerase